MAYFLVSIMVDGTNFSDEGYVTGLSLGEAFVKAQDIYGTEVRLRVTPFSYKLHGRLDDYEELLPVA